MVLRKRTSPCVYTYICFDRYSYWKQILGDRCAFHGLADREIGGVASPYLANPPFVYRRLIQNTYRPIRYCPQIKREE